MYKMRTWKSGILILAVVLVCGTANAQHRYRHHHPHRVVTVVVRPKATSHVSNRFNQKERLAMALAYLNNNSRLTVRQYAKITSLSKEAAEAELDAFALNRNIPIHAIVDGKKKFYVTPTRIHD